MNDADGDDNDDCLCVTLPSPVPALNQDPQARIDMDLRALQNYRKAAKAAKKQAEEHGSTTKKYEFEKADNSAKISKKQDEEHSLTTKKYEFEKVDNIAKITKKQDEEHALTTAMSASDSTSVMDIFKEMQADILAEQQRTLRSISERLDKLPLLRLPELSELPVLRFPGR